jgi:hypothetical protein
MTAYTLALPTLRRRHRARGFAMLAKVLWITNSSGWLSDRWGGKYVLMTARCCSAWAWHCTCSDWYIPDRGVWRHPMSISISVDHAMVPGIANRVCLNSRGEATRPTFRPPRDLFPR